MNHITHNYATYPLPHIVCTYSLIFSSCGSFYSLPQQDHVTASHSSPGDNHQSAGGTKQKKNKTQEQKENGRVKLKRIHMHHGSPLLPIFLHCRAASTFISLLPKTTFTPFIKPNLILPRARPPRTSAINTLLVIP